VDLTDQQWDFIKDLLPPVELVQGGRPGRPYRDPRDVLNGVLWVLRTGAPWADLPSRYPSSATCHRRYQRWVDEGVLEKILRRLAEHLRDVGKIDLTEGFIDGSHAGAKKGALSLDERGVARLPKSWRSRTAMVFLSPLGLKVVSDMKSDSLTGSSTQRSSTNSRSG
jgi:transposase